MMSMNPWCRHLWPSTITRHSFRWTNYWGMYDPEGERRWPVGQPWNFCPVLMTTAEQWQWVLSASLSSWWWWVWKAFLNPYHTHNNGTNCTKNSSSMPGVTQPLAAISTHSLLRLRVLMAGTPTKCAKPSSAWKAVMPTTGTLELTLTLPIRALRSTICLEHVIYSHIATSASCLVSTTKLHVSDGLDLGSDLVCISYV